MPTYEYECESCEYIFEAFHSMLANPLVDCPQCNQPKLIKLIGSGAAVIVRGTENPCTGGRSIPTKKNIKKCKKLDKLGEGKNKCKTPWWRKDRVNKKILNNPEKYIQEGKV